MGMRELEPCDLDWIERAPQQVRITTRFAAPPEKVFAAFADPATWPRWFPLMTKAAWCEGTTAGGVGKEREVKMRGFGTFRERFIAWDAPGRFAFTIVKSTSPLMRKFGEDYRLTADGSGTKFEWVMGAEPVGAGKVLAPGLRLVMRRLLTRAGRNLDRHLAKQG